jgi:hypothetical protein
MIRAGITASSQVEQHAIKIAMKSVTTCHHAIWLRSHKSPTTAALANLPIP